MLPCFSLFRQVWFFFLSSHKLILIFILLYLIVEWRTGMEDRIYLRYLEEEMIIDGYMSFYVFIYLSTSTHQRRLRNLSHLLENCVTTNPITAPMITGKVIDGLLRTLMRGLFVVQGHFDELLAVILCTWDVLPI